MPKRTDLHSILILGAGPIIIGQGAEFDYAGVQACRALKEEGYRIILVNANPASIMTDPEFADSTYIEPLQWQIISKIIEREKPDAILPTMGGQTALNCVMDLVREGILKKYPVDILGVTLDAIEKAENRQLFRVAMHKIGLSTPQSICVKNLDEAIVALETISFPIMIRSSFTLGGAGSGIADSREEFVKMCQQYLSRALATELLIEESLSGWKEFEMEVVRDHHDNCIIVCSIENLDPIGIHTGDSITVAPAQTLSDKEYQVMRNAAIAVVREIGVASGGANVQFGINPVNGKMVVIEMNPRVSRSSALASKATGFPIAKVSAKLAVGYTLDELRNEFIQGVVPLSFEPSIDYVVTKMPRFDFDKFPTASSRLSVEMKSVGEVMAIGRTFQESLHKALRSLEIGRVGLTSQLSLDDSNVDAILKSELRLPGPYRLWYLADAFRRAYSISEVHRLSKIDPWFLVQINDLVKCENNLKDKGLKDIDRHDLRRLKRKGFSDQYLAAWLNTSETVVREYRLQNNIKPVFKRIDLCAAEFPASSASLYATYEDECEAHPSNNNKIMILGGGPNRIGQGIEFDYCCVHAALALRDCGYETIMVNCNPATVSTDQDISQRLYFSSLTLEDLLAIIDIEKPQGVLVQYGGQTPLRLAKQLAFHGVNIIGTSADAIDRAECRERFRQVIEKLKLHQPLSQSVQNIDEARVAALKMGYPIMVRPSYVLGGRAMKIVYQEEELASVFNAFVDVSIQSTILLDRFLVGAVEVDVDAVCDGDQVIIAGIMEQIEPAGIHSGDSICVLPPCRLSDATLQALRDQMCMIVRELGIIGLVNAQFAIQEDNIFILEVNPRASRTIPFVSKATGIPWAKIATKVMVGYTLADLGITQDYMPGYYSVKYPVFPFEKFGVVDPVLGPEMKSTGEVMGIAPGITQAEQKASFAAGGKILGLDEQETVIRLQDLY